MRKLSHFDAFKLNKGQMNAIAGGSIYCIDSMSGKNVTFSDGISLDEAQKAAEKVLDDPIYEEEIKA